jgi:hypothetical protein
MKSPSKSNVIFHRHRGKNPKIHMVTQIAKTIVSKKSNDVSNTITDFTLYYRTIVTKKQHGTGTKTDAQTSGTEKKTQK